MAPREKGPVTVLRAYIIYNFQAVPQVCHALENVMHAIAELVTALGQKWFNCNLSSEVIILRFTKVGERGRKSPF